MKAKFIQDPGWGVTRISFGTSPSSVYVATGPVLLKDIPYTMAAHPKPEKEQDKSAYVWTNKTYE